MNKNACLSEFMLVVFNTLSQLNSANAVAQLFRHRSSSKLGYEIPPLLNEGEDFVRKDTDKADLLSAFFAKHITTESEPVPSFQAYSHNIIRTIDFSMELIRKHIIRLKMRTLEK
ncbi:unnamed protein product [Dibothriocephalus latus]|uniref:Uncharacterized protein n=1 Tax=Dibothriocephalus latus TaxID=60516 RepID=A0A3P6PC29_DIBLA|nr:unnamed protein product [Dibothriocephalus latus]